MDRQFMPKSHAGTFLPRVLHIRLQYAGNYGPSDVDYSSFDTTSSDCGQQKRIQ